MIPKGVLEESVVKPYSQGVLDEDTNLGVTERFDRLGRVLGTVQKAEKRLSLIHISEPTRPY